jgi:hypothetical protein
MKLQITLPSGEAIAADPSQFALRNNADNSAIELIFTRSGLEPLIVAAYAGAFLATHVEAFPPVPGLLAASAVS